MMLELFLIRHARADERGPTYPDDSLRPLVAKGHRQAKALAHLFGKGKTTFDHLFSSPYTRTAQTAEPLAARLKRGHYIHYLDALAHDNYHELLAELKEWLQPDDKTIALVGHEPYLSELCSILLTDQKDKLQIDFKKSAFAQLKGTLEPSAMTLTALIPFAWFKHLS